MRKQLIGTGAWVGAVLVLGLIVWLAIGAASQSILRGDDFTATSGSDRLVVDGKRRQIEVEAPVVPVPEEPVAPSGQGQRPGIGGLAGDSVVTSELDNGAGSPTAVDADGRPLVADQGAGASDADVSKDGRIRGFQLGGYGQISVTCDFWRVGRSAITPNPGWSVVRQDVVRNRRLNATLRYEDGTRVFIVAHCPMGSPRFEITVDAPVPEDRFATLNPEES